MEVPTSFRPKKTKNLLTQKKHSKEASQESIECILQDYKDFLFANDFRYEYETLDIAIRKLNYTKDDLQPFCDRLKKFECVPYFQWTGAYLSALVNNVIKENEEIILKLPDTIRYMSYMGTHLSKGRLVVEANLGDFTASDLSGGELVVKGSVEDHTGFRMSGGELKVLKNARNYTGPFMTGGKISVRGTAGEHTGYEMKGGEIHANKILSRSPTCKEGKIYEGRKKVWSL